MQISRTHAVLFTKDRCKPCEETKQFVYDLLENNISLTETLSFLKKENHGALVEAYELDKFPTLLITGPNGMEIGRVVGGAAIRDTIEERLIEIYRENNS